MLDTYQVREMFRQNCMTMYMAMSPVSMLHLEFCDIWRFRSDDWKLEENLIYFQFVQLFR